MLLNRLQWNSEEALRKVAQWLQEESRTKAREPLNTALWTLTKGDALQPPRQEDGVSCGVFTVM